MKDWQVQSQILQSALKISRHTYNNNATQKSSVESVISFFNFRRCTLKKRVTTFATYHIEILAPHSKVLCAQVIYH